jgi:hypothetical protein
LIKQTITFDTFENPPRKITQDFYFHLSPADLAEKEIVADGGDGLQAQMQRIINAKDNRALMKEFKAIILDSIGEKTPDGIGFEHTDAIRDRFRFSNAYAVLFMKLVTDAAFAQAFVNGIAGVSAEQAAAAEQSSPGLDVAPLTRRTVPQDRLPKKNTEADLGTIELDPAFNTEEAVDYVGRQTESPEEWEKLRGTPEPVEPPLTDRELGLDPIGE